MICVYKLKATKSEKKGSNRIVSKTVVHFFLQGGSFFIFESEF